MAAEKDGEGAEDSLPVLIKLKSAQKCLEKLRNVEGPRRISWDGQVNLFCITKCLNGNQRKVKSRKFGIWTWESARLGSLSRTTVFVGEYFKFCGNMVFKCGPNQKL